MLREHPRRTSLPILALLLAACSSGTGGALVDGAPADDDANGIEGAEPTDDASSVDAIAVDATAIDAIGEDADGSDTRPLDASPNDASSAEASPQPTDARADTAPGPTDAAADGADAGASGFTGVGASIAECNGNGAVLHYGPGMTTESLSMKIVWVFGTDPVSGRGSTIFGYTRSAISSRRLPLAGTPGERQVRLFINAPNPVLVPGSTYQGAIALAEWDQDAKAWARSIGSTTALVRIEAFVVDEKAYEQRKWCAGRIVGRVESIVDGTGVARLDFAFVAPLLTADFPQ
jgi:hypothetical protein